ncbi:hypothetical protein PsorP6_010970 [Peronosclerospora sorghi]|uniref:Uncharacterized protein n=1 Tax=Peronosclerospora sorghi TaxID=230839 RepID=A0ACC0VXJ8_9STRA|nr:hypothetical protein PsorP6_010970 [Peronosclerospora sorghi]
MKCIKIRTGKRLDAISLDVVLPNGQPTTFYHGGDGGTEHTLTLADGEYVETIEYHTGKKNGHTRIFYIKLSTNKGNFLEGGTQTRDVFVDQAPLYYQLGGFQGFSKDEVDMLSSIWSSTRPIPPLPVPSGDASQKEPY